MFNYILKRLSLALPTLLVISWITFSLSKCAPGDPVRILQPEISGGEIDENQRNENYRRDAQQLGLDKPEFYFSITTKAFPDTFSRILVPERKAWLSALTYQTGNWPAVQTWADEITKSERNLEKNFPDSTWKGPLRTSLADLRNIHHLKKIPAELDSVQKWQMEFNRGFGNWKSGTGNPQPANQPISNFQFPISNLLKAASDLQTKQFPGRNWQPKIQWHGLDNQYHRWLCGFFTGELGTSYHTRQPVAESIRSRLAMTLTINGLAIFLAYALAIPLGIWSARFAGSKAEIWVRRALTALLAMPVFWLGGLAVVLFATKGQGLPVFEGIAPNNPEDANLPLPAWLAKNGSRLVLPVLVLMLHALASLTLYLKNSMLQTIGQDYVRTARAKGLPEKKVFGRHAFRNALFPLITLFASVFPGIFGGSLVVEFLFNIPGMGTLTHEAFMQRDFPVLFAILMCSAILTVVGTLVADVLYALADPRVRFG